MAEIKIINPIAGKGLHEKRGYKAREEIIDEENYIEIGVVLENEDGSYLRTQVVEFKCTDRSQDKKLNGTGNVTKIAVEDTDKNNEAVKKVKLVYYYPFHYEIKTPGEHIITISAMGKTTEVKINAEEDKRPKSEKIKEEFPIKPHVREGKTNPEKKITI